MCYFFLQCVVTSIVDLNDGDEGSFVFPPWSTFL